MNRIDEAVFKLLLPRSPVFTTREVARHALVLSEVATRGLEHLTRKHLISRVTRGLWADTRHPEFSSYAVVPYLLREEEGYVSLLSALSLHGMIEQIPRAIHLVVRKQRRPVITTVGQFEFHQLSKELFGGYEPYGRLGLFQLATPAKALFDVLYLSTRKGRRFSRLPELELTGEFRRLDLDRWIKAIPYVSLRKAVKERWKAMQASKRS